jgi:L-lactate dehydrogenase complex protein LldG
VNSRDRILTSLRGRNLSLPPAPPQPEAYLPVTRTPETDLLARFTAELTRLTGKVYPVPTPADAVNKVLELVGSDQAVITWERLPIPQVNEALMARGINVMQPNLRDDTRAEQLKAAAEVRIGITGADGAFATTGTLALITEQGQGRTPSLLVPVHVALLSIHDLYTRLEDWMLAKGNAALTSSRSIAFITGPSRTADIEGETILGVHGPREIHVIVYGTADTPLE